MTDHIPQAGGSGIWDTIQNLWTWLVGAGMLAGGGAAGFVTALKSVSKTDSGLIKKAEDFFREYEIRDKNITETQKRHDEQIADLAKLKAGQDQHERAISDIKAQIDRQIADLRSDFRRLEDKLSNVASSNDVRDLREELREFRAAFYGHLTDSVRQVTPM